MSCKLIRDVMADQEGFRRKKIERNHIGKPAWRLERNVIVIIESGLLEHGVLQRTRDNVSDVRFIGKGSSDGPVVAHVTKEGATVAGFDNVIVGGVARGVLRGWLAKLPVGGPYDVALRVQGTEDETTVRDVLVGDLWVLAGQSNMEGCGARSEAVKPHPMVRGYFMDDHWDVAQDPLHDLSIASAPVHSLLDGGPRQPLPTRGAGLGVVFGQEMQRRTGVPQGLIACAHGGTSMRQWSPALKDKGSESLYGATLDRVARNGGSVAGVLWYQGCSDANPTDASAVYTERMMDLVGSFRRDFRDRTLPVGIVQIASFRISGASNEGWSEIRRQQYDLPCQIRNLTVVSAIDLPLVDNIHISASGQHRLGRRLALAMRAMIDGEGQPPIRVSSVSLESNAVHEGTDIHVRFENLVGDLQAPWQPLGFMLVGDEGRIVPVYHTDLVGDTAILHTCETREAIDELSLYYGYGSNVYCNITDSDDRAVPAFGPILLAA